MNGSFSHHDINFWIINKWGGLRTKDNKANRDAIEAFGDSLSGLELLNLDRISSWSKVASFVDPENNFIYDSKAVYSLDWLLLKAGCTGNFFPIPSGRNSKFIKYNLGTIIRLKTRNDDPFYSDDIAYQKYCNLIKDLYLKVYNERCNEPFKLEMLLFASFDFLVDEVARSVKVSIA